MAEWFEQFFDGLYGEVLATRFDNEETLRQADKIKLQLRLRKGERVLDIPCGMGRLMLPLARLGISMTGVDLSELYLKRARQHAEKEGLDVRLIHKDMRDIPFDSEFDAAFNWYGSFGYFSDEDEVTYCRKVLQALKPGGRFLTEGMNKSWVTAHFEPHIKRKVGEVDIDDRVQFDPRTGRIHSIMKFTKGNVSKLRNLIMKTFDAKDIRGVLRAAGFREIELFGHSFGDDAVTRFIRHSPRFIAVARRPKA